MIAGRGRRWHNARMPVQITIRNVPEEVRDELASRAALKRQSMQEFLREHLEQLAGLPSVEAWIADARRRVEESGRVITAEEILAARDADRR